jgi:hypothetical protein
MDYRIARIGRVPERVVQALQWFRAGAANESFIAIVFWSASKPRRYTGKPQAYRAVHMCNK